MLKRFQTNINYLQKLAEEYQQPDLVKISGQVVKIQPKADQSFWIAQVLLFLLLLHFAWAIASFVQKRQLGFAFIVTIPVSIYFGFFFVNKLKGQQIIRIDLQTREFIFERVYRVSSRQKQPLRVSFSGIGRIEVKSESGGRGNYWLRLYFFDVNGKRLAYVDFSNRFPESILIKEIKSFIELVVSNK